MPRWLWVLLVCLVAALVWTGARGPAPLSASAANGSGPIHCPPPDALADSALPRQSDVNGRFASFRLGEATVSPLAGFSLQARVLSRENYSLGRESDYSPVDLALGWGPMAAPGMADALSVSQGGRWYRYRWGSDGPPIPLGQIIGNSANMHMVPADRIVAEALGDIKAGDQVRIDGWLIRIDGDNGWRWQSSLSRDDSGNGACELVFVCSIRSL